VYCTIYKWAHVCNIIFFNVTPSNLSLLIDFTMHFKVNKKENKAVMSIHRTLRKYTVGSHGSDYVEYDILVFDGIQSGSSVMFCMILLPPASGE
jgi:hypothetical protein